MKHFENIYLFNFGLNKNLVQVLIKNGSKVNGFVRRLIKKREGEWPLLVCPIKLDYDESNWFILGLDIRAIDSWDIREICSDAA